MLSKKSTPAPAALKVAAPTWLPHRHGGRTDIQKSGAHGGEAHAVCDDHGGEAHAVCDDQGCVRQLEVVYELEAHRTGDCTGQHRTDGPSAPLTSTADDPRHDKITELPSMLWRPIIKPPSRLTWHGLAGNPICSVGTCLQRMAFSSESCGDCREKIGLSRCLRSILAIRLREGGREPPRCLMADRPKIEGH
jgi:hypothetical protein